MTGPDDMNLKPVQIQLSLTERQRALFNKLENVDKLLARIYLGGLRVLADTDNPDRLSLAAHEFREICRNMPGLYANTRAKDKKLGVETNNLQSVWKKTKDHSECFDENAEKWTGSIDGRLRKFLEKIDSFLDWAANHMPSRRGEIGEFISHIEPSGQMIPDQDLRRIVDEWLKLTEYFNAIAHHGRYPEEEEFSDHQAILEDFLMNRLKPRTFDDYRKIDFLIAEAESDDKA